MMTLSDQIPPSLYPLAWLVGSWRGWGTAPGWGEDAPDLPLLLDLEVTIEGDMLRHHFVAREGRAAGPLDVLADAHAGRESLTAGEVAWEETGTWHLTRSEPAAGPGTETFGEGPLTLEGGRFGGRATWAVRCQGPRIAARLAEGEGLAHAGTRIVEATRMYGLVGGELMWAEEAAANGGDLAPSVTARLARVEA